MCPIEPVSQRYASLRFFTIGVQPEKMVVSLFGNVIANGLVANLDVVQRSIGEFELTAPFAKRSHGNNRSISRGIEGLALEVRSVRRRESPFTKEIPITCIAAKAHEESCCRKKRRATQAKLIILDSPWTQGSGKRESTVA